MTSAARRLRVAGVLASAVAVLGIAPRLASAGGETHRAAVVVDLGDEVRTARVNFEGDSITGVEALQFAGFDPVLRAYGGQGGAVCSVCERGCPADSTCLTCGGADYWAYFRAASGASSYSYSHVGAGATQVHDGDVEAWKWGPGVAPAFVSFTDVWGESTTTATPTSPPSTAPPTAATAATSRPSSGTSSVPGGGGPASTGTVMGGAVTTPAVPTATGPGIPGGPGAGVAGSGVTSRATDSRSRRGGTAAMTTTARGGPAGGEGADPSGAAATSRQRGPGDPGSEGRDLGGAPGVGDGVAAGPVAPPVEDGPAGSAVGLVGFGAVVAGIAVWILRSRTSRRRAAARSQSA